jgi:RHS repeat-associated protein
VFRGTLTDQLKTASLYGESYSYDANGNRITANGASCQTGTDNRLLSDGVYNYTYDGAGNLWRQTKIADGSGAGAMSYDYLVYQGDMPFVQVYDADGLSGGTYSPVLTHRYLQEAGTGKILADDYQGSGPMWLLEDHEGTVHDIVFCNGNSYDVTHRVYDSFGVTDSAHRYTIWNTLDQTYVPVDTIVGFQGSLNSTTDTKCLASDISLLAGLDWMRIRVCRPATGRFLSEDPTSPPPDANFYRAFGNNPLNETDPSGRCGLKTTGYSYLFGMPTDYGARSFNRLPGR